jgi:hypothetical protein
MYYADPPLGLENLQKNVISRSEKRVKHIVLVYNVHPSCKIKNIIGLAGPVYKQLYFPVEDFPHSPYQAQWPSFPYTYKI